MPRSSSDDESPGVESSDLRGSSVSKRRGTGLPHLSINMSSYQPLSSGDPEEHKSYGSLDSTPGQSPSSALLVTNGDPDEFDKLQSGNPFLDRETAAYWRGVYDNCEYECRHVFSPELTWSRKEEEDVVRKLDWKVCLWAVRRVPKC